MNKLPNDNSTYAVYKERLGKLVEIIRAAGYEAHAFAPGKESRFLGLIDARQSEILAAVEGAIRIYSGAINSGVSAKDHRQMSWWALRELGYRPLSDAFSQIKDTDVIEVYDQNHKQIFRTLNFFPCLSYSLDEINTFEWWELYDRDEAVTQTMIAAVGKLISQEPATLEKPFETHWVQERFSEGQNRAKIESKILSPLLRSSNDAVAGYLNAFELLELRKRTGPDKAGT